jgi:hypothetical protein
MGTRTVFVRSIFSKAEDGIPQMECDPFLFEGFLVGVVSFDPADLSQGRFCSNYFQ